MFSLQNYPEQPPLRKKAPPSLAASFRGAFFLVVVVLSSKCLFWGGFPSTLSGQRYGLHIRDLA